MPSRPGDQPGVMHAPAGEGLRQLPLGRLVAEQRARLARMREALEAVGLGQRLVLLHGRRAGHQGAPRSSRARRGAQISAAIASGAPAPSITTQRCGSASAMAR